MLSLLSGVMSIFLFHCAACCRVINNVYIISCAFCPSKTLILNFIKLHKADPELILNIFTLSLR